MGEANPETHCAADQVFWSKGLALPGEASSSERQLYVAFRLSPLQVVGTHLGEFFANIVSCPYVLPNICHRTAHFIREQKTTCNLQPHASLVDRPGNRARQK